MDDHPDPISQFFPDAEEGSVDLYAVLGLTSATTSASTSDTNAHESITLDAIKKAYRRLALLNHPDKHGAASEDEKRARSLKFQQVGFAYAVLSDEKRRKRYDATGRTDESFLEGVAESEGGWDAYFEAMFEKVSKLRLDEDKAKYQGSAEELSDLKEAYLSSQGSLEHILSHIPHSTYADEPRFISLITSLISSSSVPSFPDWERDVKDEKARKTREREGKREAGEAEEAARELGVWDEFYGSGKPSEKKKKGKNGKGAKEDGEEAGDESALQALILKRAEMRKADTGSFLDSLADKYSEEPAKGKGKAKAKGKGKKRAADEDEDDDEREDDITASPRKKSRTTKNMPPPEIDDDEFAAIQARLFGAKSSSSKDKDASSSPPPSKSKAKTKPAAKAKADANGKSSRPKRAVKK